LTHKKKKDDTYHVRFDEVKILEKLVDTKGVIRRYQRGNQKIPKG
jgi:hypothetical protein